MNKPYNTTREKLIFALTNSKSIIFMHKVKTRQQIALESDIDRKTLYNEPKMAGVKLSVGLVIPEEQQITLQLFGKKTCNSQNLILQFG